MVNKVVYIWTRWTLRLWPGCSDVCGRRANWPAELTVDTARNHHQFHRSASHPSSDYHASNGELERQPISAGPAHGFGIVPSQNNETF